MFVCLFFGATWFAFIFRKVNRKKNPEELTKCQKSVIYWPNILISCHSPIPQMLQNNPHHLHHNPYQTHFQHSVCGVAATHNCHQGQNSKVKRASWGQAGTDCVPAGNPCSLSQTAKFYTQCSPVPKKHPQICSLFN